MAAILRGTLNLGEGLVRSTARIATLPVRAACAENMSDFPSANKLPARLCYLVYVENWPLCLDKWGRECKEPRDAVWFLDIHCVNLPSASEEDQKFARRCFLVYHNGGLNKPSKATQIHVAIRGSACYRDLVTDMSIFVAKFGSKWSRAKDSTDFRQAIDVMAGIITYFDVSEPNASGEQSKQLFVHGHSLGGTKAVVVGGFFPQITGGSVFNPGANDVSMLLAAGVAAGGWSLASAASAAAASATSTAVAADAAAATGLELLLGSASMSAVDAGVGVAYSAMVVAGEAAASSAAASASFATFWGATNITAASALAVYAVTNPEYGFTEEGFRKNCDPRRFEAFHVLGDVVSCAYPWTNRHCYKHFGKEKQGRGMRTFTYLGNPSPHKVHSVSAFLDNW